MRYISKQVVFTEVPNEVSLSYMITGCQLKCKWCHSASAWNWEVWTLLTIELLEQHLKENEWMITCVLFLWWEWEPLSMIALLECVRNKGLKTCLYTWMEYEDMDDRILNYLTYIKTWPYIKELWALTNPKTNQVFMRVDSEEDLTYLFNNNKEDVE